MKKIITVTLLLAFIFIGTKVGAQQASGSINAKNVKIHKKQMITDEERKVLDEKAKGVPADQDKDIFNLPATGILGESLPVGGQKYAIVAGLANYVGTANDLCVLKAKTRDQFPEDNDNLTQYCQDADSVHMKDALISRYGYESSNISIIRDGSATQANVMAAMNALKSKVGSNDEVVFFFSGHGTTGNYSLPGAVDADADNLDEGIYLYDGKVVWDDDLKQWADSLPAFRMVFTFDSCMAGGMNDLAGNNRVVVMSSREAQSSWTYYLGGYNTGTKKNPQYQYSEGLFSHYFVVEGITNGLADGINLENKIGENIAVEESFGYTYPLVELKQQPVLSDGFDNDLVL